MKKVKEFHLKRCNVYSKEPEPNKNYKLHYSVFNINKGFFYKSRTSKFFTFVNFFSSFHKLTKVCKLISL